MKRFISVCTSLILCLIAMTTFTASAAEAYTQTPITITANQAIVDFNEDTGFPFTDENGRTLVPVRAAMEALGACVQWDEASQTVTITYGENWIQFTPSDSVITKSDHTTVSMDTTAIMKNSRIFLPIRFAAEALSMHVFWDDKISSVIILTPEYTEHYQNLLNIFDFSNATLQKSTNTVTATAICTKKPTLGEFGKYWTSMDDAMKQVLIIMIAKEKQLINEQYDISIAFMYEDANTSEQYFLASVTSYNYEVRLFNPFAQYEINPLQ